MLKPEPNKRQEQLLKRLDSDTPEMKPDIILR